MNYYTTEMSEDINLTMDGDDCFIGVQKGTRPPIVGDHSRFSEEDCERIKTVIAEEGVHPDAEWLVWQKAYPVIHPYYKDEGIVFHHIFFHFDGPKILWLEEWLDWEPEYIDIPMENQDHRGLEVYDAEWSKDRKREVLTISIIDNEMIIALEEGDAGLKAEMYDTVYLEPWVMLNGFCISDVDDVNNFITCKCDQFKDFNKDEMKEVQHILSATVESCTIYRKNKAKNIDPRESYYDGNEDILEM